VLVFKKGSQSKNNPNELAYKLKKLNEQKANIQAEAEAGNIEALRTHSIIMQKIEFTKNRIKGNLNQLQCAAIYPSPIYSFTR